MRDDDNGDDGGMVVMVVWQCWRWRGGAADDQEETIENDNENDIYHENDDCDYEDIDSIRPLV